LNSKALLGIFMILAIGITAGYGIAAVVLTRPITSTVTIEPAYGLTVSIATMSMGTLHHEDIWESPAFDITNNGEAAYQVSWSISDCTPGTVNAMRSDLNYKTWVNVGTGWQEWQDGSGNPIPQDLAVGETIQAQIRCTVALTAAFNSWSFKLNILAST